MIGRIAALWVLLAAAGCGPIILGGPTPAELRQSHPQIEGLFRGQHEAFGRCVQNQMEQHPDSAVAGEVLDFRVDEGTTEIVAFMPTLTAHMYVLNIRQIDGATVAVALRTRDDVFGRIHLKGIAKALQVCENA